MAETRERLAVRAAAAGVVTSQNIATCSISRGFLSGAGSWCICEVQDGWILQMMRLGKRIQRRSKLGQGARFQEADIIVKSSQPRDAYAYLDIQAGLR